MICLVSNVTIEIFAVLPTCVERDLAHW